MMRTCLRSFLTAAMLLLAVAGPVRGAARPSLPSQTPAQFFGFKIGADGELARYPKILEYFTAAREADRSRQVRGDRQDDDGE